MNVDSSFQIVQTVMARADGIDKLACCFVRGSLRPSLGNIQESAPSGFVVYTIEVDVCWRSFLQADLSQFAYDWQH